MKKHILIVVIIMMVAALSGCLSTLHPLFTEKDLVYDPRLVGTWRAGDGDDTAFIEQGSSASFSELPGALRNLASQAYMVTYKSNYKTKKYHAFLCRIGKDYFLDYYPAENPRQKTYNAFYKSLFTKMHSFYRVRFRDNNSFEIGQFDDTYLTNLIKQKQIRIQHEVRFDGTYLITAPTEELQQYVIKYSEVEEAYNSSTRSTYQKIQ
jgi:hypothetical protein